MGTRVDYDERDRYAATFGTFEARRVMYFAFCVYRAARSDGNLVSFSVVIAAQV